MNINEAFPAAYINAASLIGKTQAERTVTIESFAEEEMPGGETKPVLRYKDRVGGLPLNRTNATALASMFGEETNEWIGKAIEMRTEKVNFKGDMRDGIRIAAASSNPQTESKVAAPPAQAAFDENDDVPF